MEKAAHQRMLAGKELFAVAGEQHRAAHFSVAFRTEHDAARGNALEAQQIMRNHDDRGPALPAERDGQVVDLLRAHGIEAGGRLVADEQLRIEREGPGEGGALLHATAQLARIFPGMGGQSHGAQLHQHRLVQQLTVAGDLRMMLLEGQRHILRHREALEQRTGLEEHAHLPHELLALAFRKAVDVFAKDVHGARGRLLHTDEDVQQRALPAAGAAEDREDVAGEDIEAHPVEHGGAVGNAFTKSRTTSRGSAGFDGGVGRFISGRG